MPCMHSQGYIRAVIVSSAFGIGYPLSNNQGHIEVVIMIGLVLALFSYKGLVWYLDFALPIEAAMMISD